ncbi:MAG: class I SAM-dependent methyltransferase [Cyanobacteriota bacterium]|nr:class I SAM-dependent methyltransferase [Cyanobacteriota bacterium]
MPMLSFLPSVRSGSQNSFELYEELPYPNLPLSTPPTTAVNSLFKMNYTTAHYYRTHQINSPEGKVLLNAGCGSGWQTLLMAASNPGAKIFAFDLSPNSVKVAEQRLRYHGYYDIEIFQLDLLDLGSLDIQFDFIGISDVMSLISEPVEALIAMRKVLKPEGVIRANFHNIYQRQHMYRMQQVFQKLGQTQIPRPQAVENIRHFLEALHSPQTKAALGWDPNNYKEDIDVLNNYLLVNDRGYRIPDIVQMVEAAGLNFVNLVDYRSWDPVTQFQSMPEFVQKALTTLSYEQRLHLFELISPTHRLIDLWADHPSNRPADRIWQEKDWQQGKLQFNPILSERPDFRNNWQQVAQANSDFGMNWANSPQGRLTIAAPMVKTLAPLLEQPMTLHDLLEHAKQLASSSPPAAGLPSPSQMAEDVWATVGDLEQSLFLFLSVP